VRRIRRNEERIEWLSEPSPKWADGVLVSKSDIGKLIRQSQKQIAEDERYLLTVKRGKK
jgi:hypothetical protein